jgi:hypothetical protein
MANLRWIGVSGDWSTSSDWSTGTVPGPSDKAVIAAPGSYTVTVTTPEDVGSARLNDPGAILEIQSQFGTLAVSGSVVVRSGTLKIEGLGFPTLDEGGILTLGGSLDIKSGGTLFLDGRTIEGGTLIVRHGGTFETNATAIDGGSSVLKNVAVLGGLTVNGGSLLLSGTTLSKTRTEQALAQSRGQARHAFFELSKRFHGDSCGDGRARWHRLGEFRVFVSSIHYWCRWDRGCGQYYRRDDSRWSANDYDSPSEPIRQSICRFRFRLQPDSRSPT